jgi:hypothetical protein
MKYTVPYEATGKWMDDEVEEKGRHVVDANSAEEAKNETFKYVNKYVVTTIETCTIDDPLFIDESAPEGLDPEKEKELRHYYGLATMHQAGGCSFRDFIEDFYKQSPEEQSYNLAWARWKRATKNYLDDPEWEVAFSQGIENYDDTEKRLRKKHGLDKPAPHTVYGRSVGLDYNTYETNGW